MRHQWEKNAEPLPKGSFSATSSSEKLPRRGRKGAFQNMIGERETLKLLLKSLVRVKYPGAGSGS